MELINTKRLQEDFIQSLKLKGKGPNTLKNYQNDLNCFNKFLVQLPRFDDNLGHIEAREVEDYKHYLEHKYPSENSKRRRLQAIRLFFDFLITQHSFDKNPMKMITPPPKILDLPAPPLQGGIELLWSMLKEKEKRSETTLEKLISMRNQLLFLAILGCGLKVSDLHQLKNAQILVHKDPRLLLNPPKSDPVTVPLPPYFKKLYVRYYQLLKEHLLHTKIESVFEQVFFNANAHQIISGGLSPRGIETLFKEFSSWTNIPITPKSLRQACILRWLQEDQGDAIIKRWLCLSPYYQIDLYRQVMNDFSFNLHFLKDSEA